MQLARRLKGDEHMGRMELGISLGLGAVLLLYGFIRSFRGLVMAAIGGAFVFRALNAQEAARARSSGHRHDGRANLAWAGGPGIRVEDTLTIGLPVEKVYAYWRDLTNLPRVMSHVESVVPLGNRRSHWVVKAPGPIAARLEWDAEVVEERENALITWRSLPGSQVDTAGSVHFAEAPGGRGTELRVLLAYSPPGGTLGTIYGRLINGITSEQVRADLYRFKTSMESGQWPSGESEPPSEAGRLTASGVSVYETGGNVASSCDDSADVGSAVAWVTSRPDARIGASGPEAGDQPPGDEPTKSEMAGRARSRREHRTD